MVQLETARDRVALVVCSLLAVALVWVLVRLVWLVISGPAVASAPLPEVPERPAASSPRSADWRLFGEAGAAVTARAPATPLALELRGLASGPDGYAVIADAAGKEAVYRVDDELPGNARVISIDSRQVEIRRDGRREVLVLPETPGGTARPASRERGREPPGADASGLSVASFSGLQGALPGADALADGIRVLPVAGGGFRVRPGRDAEMFTRLGFRANDVILAVNGRAVNDPSDVLAVFRDLDPGDRLAVRVRRDGREMTVTPDPAGLTAGSN